MSKRSTFVKGVMVAAAGPAALTAGASGSWRDMVRSIAPAGRPKAKTPERRTEISDEEAERERVRQLAALESIRAEARASTEGNPA